MTETATKLKSYLSSNFTNQTVFEDAARATATKAGYSIDECSAVTKDGFIYNLYGLDSAPNYGADSAYRTVVDSLNYISWQYCQGLPSSIFEPWG